MSRAALAEKRPFLLAAIMVALAYYYLRGGELPGLYLILLKGSAVALLAVYAALRHPGPEARLLALALGAAAVGDMVIEIDFTAGGLAFVLFHALAMGVFLRHRRGPMVGRDSWICGLLLVGVSVVAWLLPPDRALAWPVGLYALALGGMAASAWASAFPRPQVAAGALLFVTSDLLMLASLGPLAGVEAAELLIWPIYFLGQFLITTGVIRTMRKRAPVLRVVK